MSSDQPVRLGRYVLEQRLAVGGMAEVFLAHIEGPGAFKKKVVLKRVLPHFKNERRFVEMFVNEARIAARLNHPNLVQTYEFARVGTEYVLVMEYIEGRDLADIIDEVLRRESPMPFDIVISIVTSVAQGLHSAHELTADRGRPLNVVHRDISPGNIIITSHGTVKVVDFGIAKHADRTSDTQRTTLKGKLSYMSPEQALRDKVDRRSDIFSLGVVLYEMVTGELAFETATLQEAIVMRRRARYVPPHRIRRDIPGDLEDVIAKALQVKAEDRYPTCAAMAQALHEVGADVGIATPEEVATYLADLFGSRWGAHTRVSKLFADEESIPVDGELADPTRVLDRGTVEEFTIEHTRRDIRPAERTVDLPLPSEPQERAGRRWPKWGAVLISSALMAALASWVLLTGTQEAPPSAEARVGRIRVLTVPAGARVWVNGKARNGRTPMAVTGLALGEPHRVEVQREGYEAGKHEVVLRSAEERPVWITLNPQRGDECELSLDSQPPTEAFLGERKLGSTPIEKARIPCGEQVVELRNGRLGIRRRVVVQASTDAPTTMTLTLRKGSLRVRVDPWAYVFLNRRKVGRTPLMDLPVFEGSYTVRLVNPKLKKTLVVDVEVKPGKVTKILKKL